MNRTATLIEVAPRDGFQSIGPFIPTDDKVAIVQAAALTAACRADGSVPRRRLTLPAPHAGTARGEGTPPDRCRPAVVRVHQ